VPVYLLNRESLGNLQNCRAKGDTSGEVWSRAQLVPGFELRRIVEVAPRDGLQNLPPPAIPTAVKLELIERLLAAGVRNIEVGSFVRGDRVPQVCSFGLSVQFPG